MKVWEQILIAALICYFMSGGILLAYFAASCMKEPDLKRCDKFRMQGYFIAVYLFWPVVVYWELKDRWQKRTYQRLKAKFEGK